MEKIKVLFIQEKRVKNKSTITLGDLIENEMPDTYEIEYVSAKENILNIVILFAPRIVFISQSKEYDIFDLIKKIKTIRFETVVLVNLSTIAESEQELMNKLKEIGVYKCYSSSLSVDSLVHDMFVSLNME